MKLATRAVFILAACLAVQAQTLEPKAETSDAATGIEVIETVAVNAPANPVMVVPVDCDEIGNIYLRFFDNDSPLKEPVYKFNNRGERQASYSVAGDHMFDGMGKGASDFAVGKNGDVYLLAHSERTSYILKLDKTGHIKSKIQLEVDFDPSHFAVFDSGRILATGTGLGTRKSPDPHTIFTAIFESDGKLIKKVSPPQDEEFVTAAERGDSEFVEPGQLGGGNYAVDLGMVTRGSDGNLYVLRHASRARVYGISPEGEIVHSFELSPDDSGRLPAAISSFDGKLAVAYAGKGESRGSAIRLVGLDGRAYSTYDTSSLGATFACYSKPGRFTLITARNGQMHFTFADVR